MGLPTGTVTFLMIDAQSSSQERGRTEDQPARTTVGLDEAVGDVIARHGGHRDAAPFGGERVLAVFPRAADAMAAAVDTGRSMTAGTDAGGLEMRVRMAPGPYCSVGICPLL